MGNHLGPLNAYFCMERAITLQEHGMGCAALRHTNHWTRGGTYGGVVGWMHCGLFYEYDAEYAVRKVQSRVLAANPLVIAIPWPAGTSCS